MEIEEGGGFPLYIEDVPGVIGSSSDGMRDFSSSPLSFCALR